MNKSWVRYLIFCAVFWAIAVIAPIQWSSKFLRADYHHIYQHAFYFLLLLTGLLSKIHTVQSPRRALIYGALLGMASALLSILAVTISDSKGEALHRQIANDGLLSLLSVWSFLSIWLGGPIWGALIACFCWLGNRHESHAWKHMPWGLLTRWK